MAEDTQKAKDAPENETQDSAMPTEEQKTTDVKGEEVKTDSQAQDAVLPDEVKERTKSEFEKLRNQLSEERTRREYYEQLFSQTSNKKEEKQDAKYTDPETGLVNESALSDLDKRAREAEIKAKQAEDNLNKYLQDQENQQVYNKHPEINPETENFNEDLHNLTSSLLLHSMVNPDKYGDKQLTFMEAVEKAKTLTRKEAETVKDQATKEAVESLTPKEQASLEAQSSSNRRSDANSDLEALRNKTRKGDPDALAERLKKALG